MIEMLRCENCGAIFDLTEMRVKYSREYGEIESCPCCNSEEIEEVIRCNYCGDWSPNEVLDEGFCPDCAGRTLRTFRELINNTFTEEQLDFLSRVDCF